MMTNHPLSLLTMILSIILTIIVLCSIIHHYLSKIGNFFDKHGIPYIKPLPLLGNMWPVLLGIKPLVECIREVYDLHEDAKYVGFYDFICPVVVIRDSELIKTITMRSFDHFTNRRSFVNSVQEPLFGNTLFELRDEKWRRMKSLLSPVFTPTRMKIMFEAMSACASTYADYFVEKSGWEINSKDIFTRYTNDIICCCAFNLKINSLEDPNNEFYTLGRRSTDFEGLLSIKFFLVRSFPTLARLLNIKIIDNDIEIFFRRIVKDIVKRRKVEGISQPDMIQLMMETRDGELTLTGEEMASQAFLFFLGGFETSSTLMCFMAQELACNPGVQRKLQREIDEVFKRYNEDPPYEAINDLVYLDAVLAETLRKYPVVGLLDRVCNKEIELPPALPGKKPVIVRPGDAIWVPIYSINRDPNRYPDPDVFRPERFIDNKKNPGNSVNALAFGLGPRMCMGNRFAVLQTKILFAYILRKCWLKPGRKAVMPIEIGISYVVLCAKGGFSLEIEARIEE